MCHPFIHHHHLFLIIALALIIATTALTDNRCYLENGASSENFFVSEDLNVGSTIGQIRIHGDPRIGGNIILTLKESDSPVSIAPGTKNLTLKRRLDKEGIDGPASVFVNLICERLHTLDPVYVVPINIRVTDANDNAPIFINAPYMLNISEVTVVGTRVLQGVHAVDNDQQGPYSNVRYMVLSGPHSDYFEFENELEGTLVLKKALDYETLKHFDVKIRAQDHGEPPRKSDTILTVHVVDADDQNPKFLDERYWATINDSVRMGATIPVKPKDIQAVDQDTGIDASVYYTFNTLGNDYQYFKINRNTGKITLNRMLDKKAMEHPATLVIRATQQDNPDRYALATLTITRNVEDGIRFLHATFYVRVSEALPPGTIIATFANNRPTEMLKYFVSDHEILKTFGIDPKGRMIIKRKLDYEEKSEYIFKIFATDGITNDSSVVNVSVENVNEWEPRFRYPFYEFFVNDDELVIGQIEAADGDKMDTLTLKLGGVNGSLFYMTDEGELRLKRDLIEGRPQGTARLTVTAVDDGRPPRSATVPVTVHFSDLGTDFSGIVAARPKDGGMLILAGLGGLLLVLIFVVVLLIAYICKGRKRPQSIECIEKSQQSNAEEEKVSNPVFESARTPTASALGGVPSDRTKLTSPKVHPAPQPPVWPHPGSNRVKKLSWGDDKTDSDSTDNTNTIDVSPKLVDTTNLTVYF